MRRVDVDDRLDTTAPIMSFEKWLDLDYWFLDHAPAIRGPIQAVIDE